MGFGYQDAAITEKGASPQPVGSPVFQVPNWTGNASLSYTTPITNSWTLISGLDYSYIRRIQRRQPFDRRGGARAPAAVCEPTADHRGGTANLVLTGVVSASFPAPNKAGHVRSASR